MTRHPSGPTVVGWILMGSVLVAGAHPSAVYSAERIVLCEEFTATW